MATIETEDLEAAFLREYPLLHRVADANLDKKLRARVSPSDVVQDAWVEAVARFGEKEQSTDMTLSAWLKFVVRQSVNRLRRFHLGADKRTVDREQRPRFQGMDNESTVSRLVEALSASMAGPARTFRCRTVATIAAPSASSPTGAEIRVRRRPAMWSRKCAASWTTAIRR